MNKPFLACRLALVLVSLVFVASGQTNESLHDFLAHLRGNFNDSRDNVGPGDNNGPSARLITDIVTRGDAAGQSASTVTPKPNESAEAPALRTGLAQAVAAMPARTPAVAKTTASVIDLGHRGDSPDHLGQGPSAFTDQSSTPTVRLSLLDAIRQLLGLPAAFKEHNPAIVCFVVEPEGAAALKGEPVTNPGHRIQGGGYSMARLPLLNRAHVDGYLTVSDADAVVWARQLAKEEGIFAGFSSGANVAAAVQLLRGTYRGKTVVVMMCDSGLKYLSTDLWE